MKQWPKSSKALPDHLIWPPIDVLLEPIPKPKKFDSKEEDDHLTLVEKKKLKEEQKKREEQKKWNEMSKILEQEMYQLIKTNLENLK